MEEAGRKTVKKAKGADNPNGHKPYREEDLISALNHPLRRQILRLMHSVKGPLSPCQIEHDLAMGSKLSQVSYHVTVMFGYQVISLADQRQVRGALEHFYISEVSDVAWLQGLLRRTQEADKAALWPKQPRRQ